MTTLHLGTRSEGDLSAIRRRWLRLVLTRWPRTQTLRSRTASSRESFARAPAKGAVRADRQGAGPRPGGADAPVTDRPL